jgi:hypothetical protein
MRLWVCGTLIPFRVPRDRVRQEGIAEAFNALNHRNDMVPNGTLGHVRLLVRPRHWRANTRTSQPILHQSSDRQRVPAAFHLWSPSLAARLTGSSAAGVSAMIAQLVAAADIH